MRGHDENSRIRMPVQKIEARLLGLMLVNAET